MSVNAAGGVSSGSPFNLMFQTPSSGNPIDSFAQQLVATIEGYIGNVKSGSHFEIGVQSGQGQSFTVTVKDLGRATTPPPALPSKSPISAATPVVSSPSTPASTSTPSGGVTPTSGATPASGGTLA